MDDITSMQMARRSFEEVYQANWCHTTTKRTNKTKFSRANFMAFCTEHSFSKITNASAFGRFFRVAMNLHPKTVVFMQDSYGTESDEAIAEKLWVQTNLTVFLHEGFIMKDEMNLHGWKTTDAQVVLSDVEVARYGNRQLFAVEYYKAWMASIG